MGNFCPTWLTSVSLSAQGQWWAGVGTLEAPLFLRQSRGGWSPLNYPAAVQLPLCPLAAFHLSPKSGVTQSSPSETSWVTQARWLLSVAQGPGQRCHRGCLQWDGQGEGLWGQPRACPCPRGRPAAMLMWGMLGAEGGARQGGQHGVGWWNSGFWCSSPPGLGSCQSSSDHSWISW